MKKMILCSFAVASVIGTYLLNESTTYESPCLLANVEALARDEGNSDLYIRSSNGCYYEFSGPKNSEITVSVRRIIIRRVERCIVLQGGMSYVLRRIAVRVHPNKAVKLISFNVWGYFRIGIHE